MSGSPTELTQYTEYKKVIAFVLSLSLIFSPASLLKADSNSPISSEIAKQPETTITAPPISITPPTEIIQTDSSFLAQTNIISPVILTSDADNHVVKETDAPTTMVQNELMSTFGLSDEMMKKSIEAGLIKIEVDLETLEANVSIDPSIRIPNEVLNMSDLLGSNNLPRSIKFKMGKAEGVAMGMPCSMDLSGNVSCPPPPTPTYYLRSGEFNIGDKFVQLDYMSGSNDILPADVPRILADNRLHDVKIYYGNPLIKIACRVGTLCLGTLLKEITYHYDANKLNEVKANIAYSDSSKEDIASREIGMLKMSDGQYHIQSIVDTNKNGKVAVTSKFLYGIAIHPPCDPVKGCQPDAVILARINRMDANGNSISYITNIQVNPKVNIKASQYIATLVLSDGKEVLINFNTMEELFMKAGQIEKREGQLPHRQKKDRPTIFLKPVSTPIIESTKKFDPYLWIKTKKKK